MLANGIGIETVIRYWYRSGIYFELLCMHPQ